MILILKYRVTCSTHNVIGKQRENPGNCLETARVVMSQEEEKTTIHLAVGHILQKLNQDYCEPYYNDTENHTQTENNAASYGVKIIGMT